ncbi:MAG TPA: hypothetical protein PK616_07440 [Fibrobacteraceae bacterium]|nr:hypothetical protein [Fibrobacteraceae bacterium]
MKDTIDKIPFKITLPTLFSIVGACLIVAGMFYNLQIQITKANMGIAAILEKLSESDKERIELAKKVDDHEKRLIRLEK